MNSYIYGIINIDNGKIYIGSTKNLKTRLTMHFWRLKKNKHHNKHLQNSYNKNPNLFKVFLIDECLNSDQYVVEQKWINFFKKENLYNKLFKVSDGILKRQKSPSSSEETRKKISLALTGKKLSKNHIKSISKCLRGNSRRRGTVTSEIARKNMSKAAIGKTSVRRKKVIGWNIQNLDIKFEFASLTEAANYTNCCVSTVVNIVKEKYLNTKSGWVFIYKV